MDSSAELNSRPVKVYDVEEKKLIATYPSVREASRATGVASSNISKYIERKTRSKTNKFNKTICFR